MTPEEAALCLRDDPTFATSSREEQEADAALLLGTDDPLDVALAIEAALAAPRIVAPIGGGGLEPCRLNGPDGAPCGGNEPIAGNGRCLTCGAVRRVEISPVQHVEPVPAIRQPERPRAVPKAVQRPKIEQAFAADPDAAFLARFKEATGTTDKELGAMLGMSRATVQAYIGKRLPEKIVLAQARTLLDDLGERLLLLADLKRDLAAATGELD